MRLQVFFLLVLSTVRFAAGQATSPPDFRTMTAPPEVQVLESDSLVKILDFEDHEKSQLDSLLSQWKDDYLRTKQEMDALPAEDQVGRRGWPPTRDLQLSDAMMRLLEDPQRQRFNEILTLWTIGPIQTHESFRLDRTGALNLSAEQHRKLHELNVQWVIQAYPEFAGRFEWAKPDQPGDRSWSARRMGERWEAVAELAVKFKPQRDRIWSEILSPQQAQRWRELALQTAFSRYGFLVLVENARGPEQDDRPATGTSFDYLVPYFVPPVEAIQWSEQQEDDVRSIIDEFSVEAERPPQDREAWIQYFAAKRVREREYLAKIEAVMTDQQKQRWRQMLGKPEMVHTKSILENDPSPGR